MMVTLYRLDASAAQIAARFGADAGDDPWKGGDVSPTSYAPVVLRGADRVRRLVPRQWGVPPPPRIAAAGGSAVLTVRNLESPFWVGTLRHSDYRCLVPVTAFRLGARNWFAVAATPLFAFAGIWRDSEVPSFAILSCESNRLIGAAGAQAMPVILHAEDHEGWLAADWKQARRLVAPFPSQLMTAVGAPSPG